jgi:hypothetical protein
MQEGGSTMDGLQLQPTTRLRATSGMSAAFFETSSHPDGETLVQQTTDSSCCIRQLATLWALLVGCCSFNRTCLPDPAAARHTAQVALWAILCHAAAASQSLA